MSFATQIGHFSTTTQRTVLRVRSACIFKLFSAVVLDTPVLTGRLRANWLISEGNPLPETRDAVDPSGTAVLGEIGQVLEKSTGEQSVFLSNNLPYAARIEFDGWSHTKAPEGMVRKNVARFNQLIKEEAAK